MLYISMKLSLLEQCFVKKAIIRIYVVNMGAPALFETFFRYILTIVVLKLQIFWKKIVTQLHAAFFVTTGHLSSHLKYITENLTFP